jgi:tetratricopeptide (TPR) repeat protein
VLSTASAEAQHLPPYHHPGAEGEHRSESAPAGASTFGQHDGRFYGGAAQSGPSFPSYWTYNRFSNLGFGGLNYYYGPVGGYTPYIGTPYATTNYGYPNYGPYYSYIPLAPVLRQRRPYLTGPSLFDDSLPQQPAPQPNTTAKPATGARVPPPQPPQQNVKIFGKQPSADSIRRSIRYQAQGDEWFAKSNYLQAYGHYKQAVSAAPGRAEPRFRMAIALAATTNYSLAVDEIKRAMRIDASWPRTGARLDELWGEDNLLSKNAVLHKAAAWVGEDIRDPDRLFLMGVLLHFNGDAEKSNAFFEAAFELSPNPVFARAFLDAEANQRAHQPAEEPRPNPPEEDDAAPAQSGPPAPRAPAPARKAPEEPKPRPLAHAHNRGGGSLSGGGA